MDSVTTRLRRSYFVRIAIVGVLMVGLGLPLLMGGRQFGMYRLAGAVPVVLWLYMYGFEYLRGARVLNSEGVTRRDGRCFEWEKLKKVSSNRARLPTGELGALNHVDLIFPRGKVRIFPFTLENAGQVLAFVDRFKEPAPNVKPSAQPVAVAKPPQPVVQIPAEPKRCSICSELGEYHRGFQKGGRPEEDTFLPDAAYQLKVVAETRPGFNRSPVVKRCPECGAWFLYEVEYDFLVGGSEDTQTLSRLTAEQAEKLLKGEQS